MQGVVTTRLSLCLCVLISGCSLPWQLLRSVNDLPEYTASAGSWRELVVPMRDGVSLHTHVLMPEGVEHAPVVVMRTPYDNDIIFRAPCQMFARYGIGCVVQDVRGRRESPGAWDPLANEIADGEDLLTWLDGQAFVDSIALYGESYLAATALGAMSRPSKKVKTLVMVVFGTHLEKAIGERGLLHHELITAWAAYMPGHDTPSGTAEHYRDMLAHRPHLTSDEFVMGRKLDFYRTWLQSELPSAPLWTTGQSARFNELPATLTVPVLVVGGFDDPFLSSTLELWQSLGSRSSSLLALLPVNHLGGQSGALHQKDVEGQYAFKLPFAWIRHQLLGAPLPFEATGVRSWAQNGAGVKHRDEWPGSVDRLDLALSPQLAQAWPCEQRALTAVSGSTPQNPPPTVSYRYNPLTPWESEGGARGLAFVIADGKTPGPAKQTWTCRQDVVRFVTEPQQAPLTLIGSMSLALSVRSSAPDTAFVAKLVDIDERGRALHLSDGAATLRQPTADTQAFVDYAPGSSRTVTIDFWPTEWVLQPGHRLGLWVSSSNFPMFALHLNSATPWYRETQFHLAEQTLELGERSVLRLSLAK
jgi:putative CocE/NonD family hydrolase